MTIEVWFAFVAVTTLMCLTPGPAVLFVVGQGIWRGPAAALKANGAINAVNTVNFALAGLGLAAILNLSHAAFTILKWVGAAYLVWLGTRAIHGSFRPHDALRPEKPGRPFLDGLIVQASNPKAILFMGAILPQFIDRTAPVWRQLTILWATGLVIEFLVLGGYGLAAGLVRRSAGAPRVRAWLERAGGGILVAVGLATALYRRA